MKQISIYNPTTGKWITTEILNAGRILSKGEITSANATFSLPEFVPFSLFLAPKAGTEDFIEYTSVQLSQEEALSIMPFNVGCWTEGHIVIADITSTLLSKYRVFYGAGQLIKEVE